MVLSVIAGPDGQDLAVPADLPLAWNAPGREYPRRVGYVPTMLEAETQAEARANNDRALVLLNESGGA